MPFVVRGSWFVVRLVAAVVFLGVIFTPTASALAPSVITYEASEVTADSATVNGSINTYSLFSMYLFWYATVDADYWSETDRTYGDFGGTYINVNSKLTGLEANTEYEYRTVAVNGDGTSFGSIHRFKTRPRGPQVAAAGPSANVSGGGLSGVTTAELSGDVDLYGENATVYFEYGTTTSYGQRTAPQQLQSTLAYGSPQFAKQPVTARASLDGLSPNTLYHIRMVATDSTGTTTSRDGTFQTLSAPYDVTMTPSKTRLVWGEELTVTGTVAGKRDLQSGQAPIKLEMQARPFDKPFKLISTSNVAIGSTFSIKTRNIRESGMLKVVTNDSLSVASAPRAIEVGPKIAVRARRLSGGRVQVSGTVQPGLPQGRASLQRMAGAGKWRQVQRVSVKSASGNRSSYRFRALKGEERTRRYRVVVSPRRGSPIVAGNSRTISVRGRR